MKKSTIENRLEVGVFTTVESARRAVQGLLADGFPKDQITVMCSDETKERYFQEFEHQEPAGTYTPAAAITGATIGALLGGASVVVASAATGGVAILAAGPITAWAGGVAGGLVGAMMTRGVEKELANFYQQAVIDGQILVAAEEPGGHAGRRSERPAEFSRRLANSRRRRCQAARIAQRLVRGDVWRGPNVERPLV